MSYQVFIPDINNTIHFSKAIGTMKIPYEEISLDSHFYQCINARFPKYNILSVSYYRDLIESLIHTGYSKLMISSNGLRVIAYLDSNNTWQSNEVNLLDVDSNMRCITIESATFEPLRDIDKEHLRFFCELVNIRYKESFTKAVRPRETHETINLFGFSLPVLVD